MAQRALRDLGQRASDSVFEPVREYLRTPGQGLRLVNPRTPGQGLRLVNPPGYSPDFNADEAIWGRVRDFYHPNRDPQGIFYVTDQDT